VHIKMEQCFRANPWLSIFGWPLFLAIFQAVGVGQVLCSLFMPTRPVEQLLLLLWVFLVLF